MPWGELLSLPCHAGSHQRQEVSKHCLTEASLRLSEQTKDDELHHQLHYVRAHEQQHHKRVCWQENRLHVCQIAMLARA